MHSCKLKLKGCSDGRDRMLGQLAQLSVTPSCSQVAGLTVFEGPEVLASFTTFRLYS